MGLLCQERPSQPGIRGGDVARYEELAKTQVGDKGVLGPVAERGQIVLVKSQCRLWSIPMTLFKQDFATTFR
jgi:hypothetical protein